MPLDVRLESKQPKMQNLMRRYMKLRQFLRIVSEAGA
jgi:hypothetical protein